MWVVLGVWWWVELILGGVKKARGYMAMGWVVS